MSGVNIMKNIIMLIYASQFKLLYFQLLMSSFSLNFLYSNLSSSMLTIHTLAQEYLAKLGAQWTVSFRNDIPIVINSFSLDQFVLHQIPISADRKILEDYHLRQLYNLPNTPKVILLSSEHSQHKARLLLGQKAPYDFQKLIQCCQQRQLIQLFRKILTTVLMLNKKYGPFEITEKMIRASKGANPIIWINETQICNVPQYPLNFKNIMSDNSVEYQAIYAIEKFFIKYNKNFDLQLPKYSKKLTFSDALDHIQSCLDNKIIIPAELWLKRSNSKEDNRSVTTTFKGIPDFLKKTPTNKQENKKEDKYLRSQNSSAKKKQNYRVNKFQKLKYGSEKCSKSKLISSPGINQFQFDRILPSTQKNQAVKRKSNVFLNISEQSIQIITKKDKNFRSPTKQFSIQEFCSQKQFQLNSPKLKKKSKGNSKDQISKFLKQIKDKSTANNNKDSVLKIINQNKSDPIKTQIKVGVQPKGVIRDSGKSFSTTAQYKSINSSEGKRYGIFDEDLGNNSFILNRQRLVSTFGAKTDKKAADHEQSYIYNRNYKQSGKFAVKQSKIIEESNDEVFLQTPSHQTPRNTSLICRNFSQSSMLRDTQFQNEVSNLLKSQVFDSEIENYDIEQQLNNILLS